MQFPEDSSSIIKRLAVKQLEVPYSIKKIAYGTDMDLPAITLQRAIINLRGMLVEAIPVYEFSLLQTPYVDIKDIAIFVQDETEAKETLDSAWAMNVNGVLYTCNNNIKGKGNIKDIHLSTDPLCQVNLALSLVYSVAKFTVNPRAERLVRELEDLSDLPSWLEDKVKGLEELKEFNKIIISPVFYPSKNFLRKFLDMPVEAYNEFLPDDSIVIYNSADYIYGRKALFLLKTKGKKVKEFILDTDPLLSPIYLVLLAYFFKSKKEI
ncbi:MAG: hypothetical protein OWQ54_01855 [Sulfolobaceae archaeon]|nr:hypothetical protein [Sulfolobaceae archaeon]